MSILSGVMGPGSKTGLVSLPAPIVSKFSRREALKAGGLVALGKLFLPEQQKQAAYEETADTFYRYQRIEQLLKALVACPIIGHATSAEKTHLLFGANDEALRQSVKQDLLAIGMPDDQIEIFLQGYDATPEDGIFSRKILVGNDHLIDFKAIKTYDPVTFIKKQIPKLLISAVEGFYKANGLRDNPLYPTMSSMHRVVATYIFMNELNRISPDSEEAKIAKELFMQIFNSAMRIFQNQQG